MPESATSVSSLSVGRIHFETTFLRGGNGHHVAPPWIQTLLTLEIPKR